LMLLIASSRKGTARRYMLRSNSILPSTQNSSYREQSFGSRIAARRNLPACAYPTMSRSPSAWRRLLCGDSNAAGEMSRQSFRRPPDQLQRSPPALQAPIVDRWSAPRPQRPGQSKKSYHLIALKDQRQIALVMTVIEKSCRSDMAVAGLGISTLEPSVSDPPKETRSTTTLRNV